MDRIHRSLSWRLLAALGLGLCLVVLFVQPAPAHNTPMAAFVVLLPIILFGLVLIPRSLWPSSDLDQRFAAPVGVPHSQNRRQR